MNDEEINKLKALTQRMRDYTKKISDRNHNEGYADLSEGELYDEIDTMQMRWAGFIRELDSLLDKACFPD